MIDVMVVGFSRNGPYGEILAGLCRLKNPSSRVTIDVSIGLGIL